MKVWIIEELLILNSKLTFKFISLKDESKSFEIELPTKEPLNVHLMKKSYTFKKKDKDYLFL